MSLLLKKDTSSQSTLLNSVFQRVALQGSSEESVHLSVFWESLWWETRPGSVVSGSSFLHAGGFRFRDVLIVGLVLKFPTEVLDSFVQAFLQGHLSTRDTTHTTY